MSDGNQVVFTLEIQLGNDAMQTSEEVAETLRSVAEKIDFEGKESGAIMDENGNSVGRFEVRKR